MSVIVVMVTPVLIGGWSILGPLISAAAAALGYKLLGRSIKKAQGRNSSGIEIADENSEMIEETIVPEEELVFEKDGIVLTFKKDARGKFAICVDGEGKTKEELTTAGKTILNKIKQQYAYRRIVNEMGKRGYNVVEEERAGNQIKLILRRFRNGTI